MKKKYGYQMGGDLEQQWTGLGSQIGSTVGGLGDAILPGLGQILGPALGQVGSLLGQKVGKRKAINKEFSTVQANTNPYGYELGGALVGQEDLAMYKGREHRHGGILVNEQGTPTKNSKHEVEGKETRLKIGDKAYIFSEHLKL